jgi:hypothetical protein
MDVLVTKKRNGTKGHTMYTKPTLTDLYLHAESHRHPSQKHVVFTTLMNRAKTVCDTESLNSEIRHLKEVFRNNSYNRADLNRATHHDEKATVGKE